MQTVGAVGIPARGIAARNSVSYSYCLPFLLIILVLTLSPTICHIN